MSKPIKKAVLLLMMTFVVIVAYPYADSWLSVRQSVPVIPNTQLPLSYKGSRDIVFVLDANSASQSQLNQVKEQIKQYQLAFPLSRIGLVAYRSSQDQFATLAFDFSSESNLLESQLARIAASGRRGITSSIDEALFDALYTLSWRKNLSVQHNIVLVSDNQHDVQQVKLSAQREQRPLLSHPVKYHTFALKEFMSLSFIGR
ncbi:vWA domain-containing protein [Pleionea sp. CnH1-48]|uniref:VWA domain-containing protein n=1 Tax=Pleionea sp. CnH1-48 TaxID=2954494 RepID=UPI002097F4DE|nr:vWA domain-containing protein [Pleionea sp. CnH1-48]MCO7222810.1 VWA domain-containing protein [Pleionea sp. CnH1-48]